MATTQPSPSTFQYGQSCIVVHNSELESGYFNGLIGYLDGEGQPLTDTALAESLLTNLLDESASREWNAGYLLGAMHSLLLGTPDHSEPDAPQVQLGTVTLHLNHWRFRGGFYTGQREYRAERDERDMNHVITASELLRAIAYRDPESGRYHLADDAVNALEDVLGRFTGFLCAALFSPSREPNTEPLQDIGMQKAEIHS